MTQAFLDPGSPPARTGGPDQSWQHRALYDRVVDALHALPSRFQTKLHIAGVAAADLFTLNTPLGAAIEQSVVDNLNDLRRVWDPEGDYERYSFVRQPQAFPDVRLQTSAPGVSDAIIMGIELKGWFLLAKEGEPSFRYRASPTICQRQDLLVVYPWHLDEVTSGTPQLTRPFIEEARYAGEHRNHYWLVTRGVDGATITYAAHQNPYPAKGCRFNDEAHGDSGSNFGRVARGGLMTDFITELMAQPLAGIPAKYWHSFLKAFADGAADEKLARKISVIRKAVRTTDDPDHPVSRILDALSDLIGLGTSNDGT